MAQPAVLLSALADEAAFHLSAIEQFSALAALGLEYYSLRNIDVGKGVKNVMKLSMAEIQKVRHLEDEYGLNVASIASPIGKVKLLDKAGLDHVDSILVGPVAETLCKHATANKVDLIYMGTRGLNAAANFVVGSVATKVLHLASVPVLLVK